MTAVSKDQKASRVLLFSHRNIFDPLVFRCPFQEFQDVIQQIDGVDVVAPHATSAYWTQRRAVLKLGEFVGLPMNPGVSTVELKRDYDLFFTVCDMSSDLLHLLSLKGWRERCKTTVCWLPEFYLKDIETFKSCITVLKQFDYVVFMFVGNEPFKRILPGKSRYLPAGIDMLRFCPYPNPPIRSIDVLSIGRRAPALHQALIRMAAEDDKFYLYDTISGLRAHHLGEHRLMFANMAKRSRYFIVSPGKFDSPQETGGQLEFGYRYFEAAGAGAMMIGMRTPNNPEFDKIFHWEDAVIEVPFDSDAIIDVIRDLDKNPERQMRMSRTNILQCLLHHDWMYRWEAILRFVGMEPLPAMNARRQRLMQIADTFANASLDLAGVHPLKAPPAVDVCPVEKGE